ncbi:MAG TPA: DUF2911 domain-containing protein [Thermoanaerobaculia bacterium]|nr:DUF2911 domain-containing protein [Thermoanaerobaculia bacterium]
MRRSLLLIISTIVLVALPASAQVATPRPSQKASVVQTIGTANITVDYHRPGVKGRTIWGGLVPYDKPWRMGANEATTITFSDAVKVEGKDVPAGTYSFFAIPGKENWTLILNKDPKQWGAYGYDEKKDQLRVAVTPAKTAHTEWMRVTIDPTSPTSAIVMLNWEKAAIPMRVDVDVPKIVWKNLDAALTSAKSDDAMLFGSAASFALDSNQRLDEGLVWIDKSIAAKEDVFNLWTKAQLLHKKGRMKEAHTTMEKGLSMARGKMPADFMAILEGTMKSIQRDMR